MEHFTVVVFVQVVVVKKLHVDVEERCLEDTGDVDMVTKGIQEEDTGHVVGMF